MPRDRASYEYESRRCRNVTPTVTERGLRATCESRSGCLERSTSISNPCLPLPNQPSNHHHNIPQSPTNPLMPSYADMAKKPAEVAPPPPTPPELGKSKFSRKISSDFVRMLSVNHRSRTQILQQCGQAPARIQARSRRRP